MKNVILFTIVLTVYTNFGCSQNSGGQDAQEQPPVIEFQETIHDFGGIEYGGNGSVEFKFKNTGKSPLILSNVKSSCGCTVPNWSKEPVKKGGEGIIKVKYDTRRVGAFTKSITVTSNATNPTVVLQIKGKVNPPVTRSDSTQN